MLLMNKLNNDIIINHIEPYTRRVQSKNLLEDIRNNKATLKVVHTYFSTNILKYLENNSVVSTIKPIHYLYIIRTSWLFWEIDLIEYLIRNDFLFKILSRSLLSTPIKIIRTIAKYINLINIQDNIDNIESNISGNSKQIVKLL